MGCFMTELCLDEWNAVRNVERHPELQLCIRTDSGFETRIQANSAFADSVVFCSGYRVQSVRFVHQCDSDQSADGDSFLSFGNVCHGNWSFSGYDNQLHSICSGRFLYGIKSEGVHQDRIFQKQGRASVDLRSQY